MTDKANIETRIMIGGQALRAHGHDRHTDDVDWAVSRDGAEFVAERTVEGETLDMAAFAITAEVWAAMQPVEINGQMIADPQSLAELKGFALIQHCRQGNWTKVAADEYDLQFLGRVFGITELPILARHEGAAAAEAANELTAHIR